jgi:phosphopantothenoylcysteine decarboxylase / phosphopantothenate---cysteine ligase
VIVASGRPIVLGISGGIAAYKTPSLVRLLQKNGFDVKTVCTQAALKLVAQQALFTISGHPVFIDEPTRNVELDHIELSKWGELLLICPATANTLAKLAHGIADNLLTSLALSFQNRLVVAPAMNSAMWENDVTRENVAALLRRNVRVLPVDDGELACGDTGPGRLLSLESIVEQVLSLFTPQCLAGKNVLIASGPTCEPIDAVRVLTNRSSGKMGSALALAALRSGARVTVVSGPAATALPAGARIVRVFTAIEMRQALEKEFNDADICIMAAAISDFRPKDPLPGKKRCDRNAQWDLKLIPNPDIAEYLGSQKKRRFLVCFSLETDDDATRPQEKMLKKKCDMMVVNRADLSLERDETEVTLLFPDHPMVRLPMQSKKEAAGRIIERIAREIQTSHG